MQLSPLPLPSPQAMYLVYLPKRRNQPAVTAFRAWITSETAKFMQI